MLRDKKGSVALEFAVAVPILAAFLAGVVDVGAAVYGRMQVQNAAQAGVEYALVHGWNSAAIQSAVTNATTATTMIATPAPSQSCGCASGSAISAVSCSTTCPDGTKPGTYVVVSAQLTYNPPIPYYLPFSGSTVTLNAQSIARIN
jgi:Flp pilus assembly protein TadG